MSNEDDSNHITTSNCFGQSTHPITSSEAMIKEYCKLEVLSLKKSMPDGHYQSTNDALPNEIKPALSMQEQVANSRFCQQSLHSHPHSMLHPLSIHKISMQMQLYLNAAAASATAAGNQGRWTKEEHVRFVEGISLYGKNWKKVEEHVSSRTGAQIRSHAQKFFNKLERDYNKKHGISNQQTHLQLQQQSSQQQQQQQQQHQQNNNHHQQEQNVHTQLSPDFSLTHPNYPTAKCAQGIIPSRILQDKCNLNDNANNLNGSTKQPNMHNPCSSSNTEILSAMSLRTRSDSLASCFSMTSVQQHDDDHRLMKHTTTTSTGQPISDSNHNGSTSTTHTPQDHTNVPTSINQILQFIQGYSTLVNRLQANNHPNKENFNYSAQSNNLPQNHESFFNFIVNKYNHNESTPLQQNSKATSTSVFTKAIPNEFPVSQLFTSLQSSTKSDKMNTTMTRMQPALPSLKQNINGARKSSFTLYENDCDNQHNTSTKLDILRKKLCTNHNNQSNPTTNSVIISSKKTD